MTKSNVITAIAAAILASIICFFVANPLVFKYLLAMVGGSIQAGHL